ncbi:MAG: YjgP/YjgQ family permease [Moorea sp. SIO3G5]|nr:YjgP/YjgQ family permease [Moorena sp. SIO3G5]
MKFGKSKSIIALMPGLSVMDLYIVFELIPPLLFGIGAFSSLGVAIGTLFELVRKVTEAGLPLGIALQVLLLQIPQFISYALPMSMLLAALMAYSRLSSDSELIAMRSFGVSIYRLIIPAVVVSLLVTSLTFVFNELVVPAANYQSKITLDKALKKERPSFQERNIFYPEYQKVKLPNGKKVNKIKRWFYAEEFDGKQMRGLTILDFSQTGLEQIVTSESAVWNPTENLWDFLDGTIYIISPDASYRNILRFQKQKLQLPRTPLDLAKKNRDYGEMNIAQSLERLQVLRHSGNAKKIRKLRIRIQQKISFPFVCLVFGLVGAALGTRPQRTGKATSFGISVLVIFSYYLLGFITNALGLVNIFSPVMAAWLPNLFGLGAGGLLLYRAAR